MVVLEQSKRNERDLVKSPTITPKSEQAIELSKELNKMVAKPTKELDVDALLAEPSEFI